MSTETAEYIATFFTHYDAILFQRSLRELDIAGQLMPVPRRLSSSCGACVRFRAAELPATLPTHICEQLVMVSGNGYTLLLDRR